MDEELKTFFTTYFLVNQDINIPYQDRFNNKLCNALIISCLTGEPPTTSGGSHSDMLCVTRMYKIIPERWKPQADAAIVYFKNEVYKDPDKDRKMKKDLVKEIDDILYANGYL